MRILLLDPDGCTAIARVVSYAFAHRFDRAAMLRLQTDESARPEIAPYRLVVPFGFGCVFTVEEQEHPGWVRHLAVGFVDGRSDEGPHPDSVEALMAQFGFRGRLGDCHVFTRNEGTAEFAINVMEALDRDGGPSASTMPGPGRDGH